MKQAILLVITLLLVLLPAQAIPPDLEALTQEVSKIKDNLNQDPQLFQRFAQARFSLQASFGLVDQAKLDGTLLVNPKGGSLDLVSLSHLPGLTHAIMLPSGGFRFTYAPAGMKGTAPAEVQLEGFQAIRATEAGIHADSLDVTPTDKLTLKKSGDHLLFKGAGVLNDGQHQFDLQSPDKDSTITARNGMIYSITVPGTPKFESSLKYAGHEVKPQQGDMTLYVSRDGYDKATGNKVYIGDKVSIAQDSGRMLLDRYYMFKDGKTSLVRRAFLKGFPVTPVDYTYRGKLVSVMAPIPPDNLRGYKSIVDLFGANGYGSGAQNKEARRAYYTKYIGPDYRGTAAQNNALLNKFKIGEIPFFPEGEKRFEFVSDSDSFTIQATRSTTAPEALTSTRVQATTARKNTALIKQTAPYFKPDLSSQGRLETVNSPPEGVDSVQGKVTYYFTPVFDPRDESGVSEKSESKFRELVKREGSGIFYNQNDQRWYHRDYKGRTSLLGERNAFGITASGKTPTIGMIAAPKGIPLGSIAYVETVDGTYAKFLVADRGGSIIKKGQTYRIDIFAGVGRPAITQAEKTNSLQGIRIPKNPRIYFARPEA